jgi:hypothetical protein
MAILDVAVRVEGNTIFQAAPTVVWPVNFRIASLTICSMTVVLAPLAVTAALLKLTTTLPGHLLPGPGAIAADVAEKIESTLEATVIPAAPMAVILRKFRRPVEMLLPMAFFLRLNKTADNQWSAFNPAFGALTR